MDLALREFVRGRAGNACEYCHLPQDATALVSFLIEHIVSKQHGGSDAPEGLALACDRCNAYKRPNLTSIDRDTKALVPLFNPRDDNWNDHFAPRTDLADREAERRSAAQSAKLIRSRSELNRGTQSFLGLFRAEDYDPNCPVRRLVENREMLDILRDLTQGLSDDLATA